MVDYVESFVINRRVYGIEAMRDGRFHDWVGGCGIYKSDTLEDARAMLHTYACNQMRAEIGTGKTMMDNAAEALNRLGSDPFNLGKFRR